jgi:transposase
LVANARGPALLGDTGYDSKHIVAAVESRGMRAVIHPRPERRNPPPLDPVYRERYRVELFFHNLKRFRGVATRYDKTARNYLGLVHLACAWLWLN